MALASCIHFFIIEILLLFVNLTTQWMLLSSTPTVAALQVSTNLNATSKTPTCWTQRGNENGNETIILHSSPQYICSWHVRVPLGASALLLMLHDEDSSLLYIEATGELEADCRGRYAAIKAHSYPCQAAFLLEYFTIHLNGNVSVVINEVLLEDLGVKEPQSICIQVHALRNESGSVTKEDCLSIKRYDSVITCNSADDQYNFGDYNKSCHLPFPLQCTSILGQREVSLECIKQDTPDSFNEHYYHTSAMLIYPSDIEALHLTLNHITRIQASTFHSLHNLKQLFLDENLLQSIDPYLFESLVSLQTLDLAHNSIHILYSDSFYGLNNLTVLILSFNRLTHMESGTLQHLTNLRVLHLSWNELKYLHPATFRNLTSLVTLNLAGNRLLSIQSGLFDSLHNLKTLYLSDNNMEYLNATLFQNLTNLSRLYLDQNRLKYLHPATFRNLTGLIILNLKHNRLLSIQTGLFEGLHNLKRLYLSNNSIEYLDATLFQNLTNLILLDLFANKLISVPPNIFKGLKHITHLFLSYNELSAINDYLFTDLTSVKHLELNRNKLHFIGSPTFHGLYNLIVLYLHHNMLQTLPGELFLGLHQLFALFLNNNNLLILDSDVFMGLYNLTYLSLAKNQLTEITHDLFQSNAKLSFLDFSNNNFTSLPHITYLTRLTYLNLINNTLFKLKETLAFLNGSAELYVSQAEICECYSPFDITCTALNVRSPYLTCERLLSNSVLRVSMWVIGFSALFGNAFVLGWRNRYDDTNKVQSVFLSNLAMSDLLMGIYMIIIASADIYYKEYFPMNAETWRSSIMCKIAGALSITSSEGSVFFVTLISIDRFIGIKYPYSNNKLGTRATLYVICLLWFISLSVAIVPSIIPPFYPEKTGDFYEISHVCIGLPLALIYHVSTNITHELVPAANLFRYMRYTIHTLDKGRSSGMYFSVALFLGVNCICYFIILICYIEIIRAVYKSSRDVGRTQEMTKQMRLTLKVAAIVGTDFICWFPVIILGILVQIGLLKLPSTVIEWLVTFALPINSAINPFLYTIGDFISVRKKNKNSEQNSQISLSSLNRPK